MSVSVASCRRRLCRAAAGVVVGAVVVAGCAAPAAQPRHSPQACGSGGSFLRGVELRGPGEPELALPVPRGWLYHEFTQGPSFVRALIDNPSLAVPGSAPNVLVILDTFTSPDLGTDADALEDEALQSQVGDIGRAAEITAKTSGAVCGHPSLTVHYVIKNQPSWAVLAAAADGDKAWVVRLNFLPGDPHNPIWIADTEAMTRGLRFILAGPRAADGGRPS